MRTTWCVIFAASAMMGTIDVLRAQPEENPGRNEFLQSCASCHGVSGKGDGPIAKSLSPRPSDLTRLSEANNGVFPVSRVHEIIDGRIERLVHGTRDMPVWGERYMREMISPESPGFVSKEWAEAMVRRRILALVEYISTLQRATRRSAEPFHGVRGWFFRHERRYPNSGFASNGLFASKGKPKPIVEISPMAWMIGVHRAISPLTSPRNGCGPSW